MKRFVLILAVLLGIGLVVIRLLSPPKMHTPRLVLVVATCTVNKDYLGPYNAGVLTTPSLQRFAEKALVFDRHYTAAAQSGTAYATMFSGRLATGHGVLAHPEWLGGEQVLLPEVFASGGYETHSWLDHGAADEDWNYAQGVDILNQHEGRLDAADADFVALLDQLRTDPERRAFVLTNFTVTHSPYSRGGKSVIKFCRDNPAMDCESIGDSGSDSGSDSGFDSGSDSGGDSAAKLADFWDAAVLFWSRSTEFSYDTDRRMRAARAQLGVDVAEKLPDVVDLMYRADVAELDGIFGDILAAIESRGLLEDSLIVFTADHGEAMTSAAPFRWAHSFQLTPEVLHVPLMVYGPAAGVPAGRYSGVSRSVDILPTISSLAGLDASSIGDIDGLDLSAAVRGKASPPELLALSHTALYLDWYWDQYKDYEGFRAQFPTRNPELMWVSARSADYFFRLHRTGRAGWERELFDLREDPLAQRNVYVAEDDSHEAVFAELRSFQEALVATAYSRQDRDADADADAEEDSAADARQEVLRSLGYIE